MRGLFVIVALHASACATPGAGHSSAERGLAISLRRDLSREVSGTRPVLVVEIANRSQRPLCIPRETLENPNTYEMELHLYDARGRAVEELHGEGYIPPPLEGIIRLEPGGRARGQFYLDGRLKLGEAGAPLPPQMSAEVSFGYDSCDDSRGLRARSARQPI